MIKRYWNKPEEIKKKLKALNFKMYRYYSIEKNDLNKSLSNLKNSFIYFNNPNNFNDPFDSNIGASFSDTLGHKGTIYKEMKQKHRINQIISFVSKTSEKNNYICFWDCFIEWLPFKNKESVYFFDVLKYLYLLRSNNNNEGARFLNSIKKENSEILLENEYEIIDFLISNDATKKYLGIIIKNITNLEITKDDYIGSIESMYRLVNKDAKNDNDIYLDLHKHISSLKVELNNRVSSIFRIACFSEAFDSVLMWSHYANKHSGFCVEYDFRDLFLDDDYDKMIAPVVYSKKRMSVVAKSGGVGRGKYREYDRNLMYAVDCLFAKSSDWSYEKEWRVVACKSEDISEFNKKVKISKIILGANIDNLSKKKLLSIAKNKGISVYQMSIDDAFYRLNLGTVLL